MIIGAIALLAFAAYVSYRAAMSMEGSTFWQKVGVFLSAFVFSLFLYAMGIAMIPFFGPSGLVFIICCMAFAAFIFKKDSQPYNPCMIKKQKAKSIWKPSADWNANNMSSELTAIKSQLDKR